MADVPQPGDKVYMFSADARMDFQGIVLDPDVPLNMAATMQMVGMNGVVTFPVLVGRQGPPGVDRPIIKLIYDPQIDDASKLPQLTNTPEDVQKGYVIGSLCHWWDGRQWRGIQLGVPGPSGPVPIISWSVVLLDPDGSEESNVKVTGSDAAPGVQLRLKVPKGPKGDSGSIRLASDYDDATPPAVGDLLTWTPEKKWAPRSLGKEDVAYYTVPQSQFKAQSLVVGANVPVGSFTIPKQSFDWKPWVSGCVKITGAELDLDPFSSRIEVRKDSMDGPLCAVGFGTPTTMTVVSPHFSSPGNKTAAVNANNDAMRCEAGKDAVFHVVIAMDQGIGGVYSYNPDWTEFHVECKRVN
ncbi:bacteriophage minor tail subunit [Segniliparus rotundus DSM 44985]|uniref:Bacteriophage minor tail subunit n=1 Tax=Segniliparus rotundus (strain ATCC BAA-972 / CDC 1076 / CIP 108378 / DSM 44985 / JCM 13578) TaxID=640132 RepID=D6Z9P5_SEGRD|nr:hypothetical protein [Segniliparus rotundus]ADG96572.1 bacteriophage minor tail subunit [Segniliparus rotundus DSM 44985]